MIHKFSFAYIAGMIFISIILYELSNIIFNYVFPKQDIICFLVDSAICIGSFFYILYCFGYHMKITDEGISEYTKLAYSPFFYLLTMGFHKAIHVQDNNEYLWEKVQKVEVSTHWFFPCVSVRIVLDSKVKTFRISPFLQRYTFIYKKIKEKIDPYFIEDEARKILGI